MAAAAFTAIWEFTIDRWESLEDWRTFRSRFAAEYERLDRQFEGLASREAPLGEYTTVAP
jgi:hypothetical protein